MKTAIIFGITGQDGSHLADLLISKGYSVIGVARRCSVDTTQRIKHLKGEPLFQLIEGDITDVSSVTNILKDHDEVDEIYNLAAQSHVGTSFKQPGLTWDITGKGCINILQAIVDNNMQWVKFYQASSSEMFGGSYDTDTNGCKYQNENTKFLPQSPYAIAKCAAHFAVRLYREAYGLHASSGILFNHEGPRRGDNFVTKKITNWLVDFINWTELHEININDLTFGDDYIVHCSNEIKFPKLRLGNLEACRDWGYAGDYVEAMHIMLQQDEPDDYVVCTGKTHTIKDFIEKAFNYFYINEPLNFIKIDPELYRPAEVDYLRGDSSKAQEKLGWQPKCDLEKLVILMLNDRINEKLQSYVGHF
jgi:GDPmannose 4,6-dehydratase